MPGLADMHAHFLEEGKWDAYFPLYLASGVTTVRLMGTPPDLRSLRDDINRGTRLGPTLLLAGKLIDRKPGQWQGSHPPATPGGGRKNFDKQKRAGYHLLKAPRNP